MTVLFTQALGPDVPKIRWLEPYVTSGLNQKTLGQYPKGVFAGFTVVPDTAPGSIGVFVQKDPVLGFSGANIFDVSTADKFCITLILPDDITLDLTAYAATTVFVTIDAQYQVGVTTVAQIKVVDAAELALNPNLVVLAKVNVPGATPLLASDINLGYRLNTGDSLTDSAKPWFNLVFNSSFESDVDGGPVSGWTLTGTISGSCSTTFFRTGSKSLKLISAGNSSAQTAPMPVVPGSAYRASAWFRTDPAGVIGTGFQLQIVWLDKSFATLSTTNVEAPIGVVTTTFTERKLLAVAPALAAHARLRVSIDSGTFIAGYVDDVQFSTQAADTITHSTLFGGSTVAADQYHSHTAAGLNYAGGPAWADGTTNLATTVEDQIDKMLSDLTQQTGTGGAGKIGFTPAGNIAANRLDTALAELDTEKAGLGLANVFTAANTFNVGITFPSSQGTKWPNWQIFQASPTQLSFQHGVSDTPIFFEYASTNYAYVKTDNDSGILGIFGSDDNSGGVLVGSRTSAPVYIVTNDTIWWRFTDQVLTALSPGTISQLADPAAATDAAHKDYVDRQRWMPGCRLSVSNTNRWTASAESNDLTGTTLYLVPYYSSQMPIPANNAGLIHWVRIPDAGISVTNSVTVTNTNYDVFLFNVGSPTLFLKSWSSASARGFTLSNNGGYAVNTSDYTGSSGPNALMGLYVGTIRTADVGGSNRFVDAQTARFVCNFYNQIKKPFLSNGGLTSASYFPQGANNAVTCLNASSAGSSVVLIAQCVSGLSSESGTLYGKACDPLLATDAAAVFNTSTDGGNPVKIRVGFLLSRQTSGSFFYGGPQVTITASASAADPYVCGNITMGDAPFGFTEYVFGVQCTNVTSVVFNFGTRAMLGDIKC